MVNSIKLIKNLIRNKHMLSSLLILKNIQEKHRAHNGFKVRGGWRSERNPGSPERTCTGQTAPLSRLTHRCRGPVSRRANTGQSSPRPTKGPPDLWPAVRWLTLPGAPAVPLTCLHGPVWGMGTCSSSHLDAPPPATHVTHDSVSPRPNSTLPSLSSLSTRAQFLDSRIHFCLAQF